MKDGGRHVIAAGHDNFLYKVVEKYDVLEDNWTFANDMPIELSNSDSVPYEETFVVVGGQIGDACLQETYNLNSFHLHLN